MKKFTQIIAIFLLISFCLAPFPKSIGVPESTHSIAGYGPVYGELFSPKSMQIFGDKVFVIDEFGVSSFDIATRQFIKRFPVDLGREDLETGEELVVSMDDSQTWVDWLQNPGSSNFLRRIVPFGSGNVFYYIFDSRANKIDLNIDSNGLIYLMGMKGIQVYNPETGELLRTITVPIVVPIEDPATEMNYFTSKIYQDKLVVLQSFYVKSEVGNKSSIQIFSLEGQLEKVISVEYESPHDLLGYEDFTYLSDIKLYAFWNMEFVRCTKREGLNPVFLCDETGKEVKTTWDNDHGMVRFLEYQAPNRLVCWGGESTYHRNAEGLVEFSYERDIPFNNGFISDITVSDKSLGIITTKFENEMWDYKVMLIQGDTQYQIGRSPNRDELVFASTAFAVDKDGILYQANIPYPVIHQFNQDGITQKNLSFPEKYTRDIYFREMVVDEKQNLYIVKFGAYGNAIYRYSISTDTWHDVSIDREDDYKPKLWYCMAVSEGDIYLLDSGKFLNDGPCLTVLKPVKKYYIVYQPTEIELSDSPPIKSASPPFFIGFKLTETEYQFLDCANQEIWIYSRSFETFQNRIRLPKNVHSFYSSFDLYPDGTFLVTDAIQNKFLHLSKTGEVLETFGESGAIAIGTTKEAYQMDPYKFNGLFRAKIANGYIYANDLFNYRFHIFPIPARPSIEWSNKDIKMDKASVFEDTEVEFSFKETTNQKIPFILSSATPWVKIQNQNGYTTDEKIKFIIQGSKLFPWDFNAGKIQVSFPDFPELNTDLRILIDYAVGNIVKIAIGSDKAILNDKEITLDTASIPLLKNGRTFVGIRFMGEIVFSNKAIISYEPKSQTVFFELGSKKIELYIGKPYALVNGVKVALDAPPFIQNGRTFIPLRFVSENLDASVEYDAGTQATTITIIYPKKNP